MKQLLYILFAGLFLSSCSKDETNYRPGEGQLVSVNFYGASQTFPLYGQINGGYPGIGIFVDTTVFNWATINSDLEAKIPFFKLDGSAKSATFPYLLGYDDALVYLDIPAGSTTLDFQLETATSNPNVVHQPVGSLLDTTVNLTPDTDQIIYFTDAPAANGAKAAYRVVTVEQPREKAVTSDRVSVRLVNLSSDAGSARMVLLNPDGSETAEGLPQQLGFAQYSDYIGIDPSGKSQFGQLLLHLYVPDREDPLLVGVPALAGQSFEILLTGMKVVQDRQIVESVGTDGTLSYKTVTLPQSLGTTVRRTY
mgnify:CR=1 FL=1